MVNGLYFLFQNLPDHQMKTGNRHFLSLYIVFSYDLVPICFTLACSPAQTCRTSIYGNGFGKCAKIEVKISHLYSRKTRVES